MPQDVAVGMVNAVMRSENRKSSRIAKALEGHIERVATVLVDGEEREVKVHVVDVSRDGVGFVSLKAFDKGAFVRLTMGVDPLSGSATHDKHFTTSAVVRECVRRDDGTFHVGAEIKGQTGRELDTWTSLVRMWSPKQF